MREVTGSTRSLKGTRVTLKVKPVEDGAAITVDGTPPPTVTIVGDDGTTIVTDGVATVAAPYVTYALTAAQTAQVNRLTATWSIETTDGQPAETFVTYHEIVSEFLFNLADVRAYDGGELANTTAYPDLTVQAWRDAITDTFEAITNRAFGGRFAREIHDGDGSALLLTRAMDLRSIRAGATRLGTSWTALTADQLAAVQVYDDGSLYFEGGSWPAGHKNCRVDLEYGLKPGPEIAAAGMRILRHMVTSSDIPDRAIMEVSENGTYQLSVAGRRNAWFGIPDVDAVLARYRVPVVR